MIIFVMMLVSTALMYYYFQRTRTLQREISALKSGIPPEEKAGFFDFLGWNKSQDASVANSGNSDVTVPASTPAPTVATPESVSIPADSELPPSGAVSTPRPANLVNQENTAANLNLNLNLTTQPLNSNQVTLEPLGDNQTASELETNEPAGREPNENEATQEEPPAAETPTSEGSLYDHMPAVRVRSPRQREN